MRRPQSTPPTVEPRQRRATRIASALAIGAVAFVVIIGIAAALSTLDGRSPADRVAIGAAAVAAAPDAYYGKTVTIAGDVADVYGPRMFTLDEDTLGADTDLLVLLKHPLPSSLEVVDDATVVVTGTVRRFTGAELARDYEWIDASWFADRDLPADERRPVLVADAGAVGGPAVRRRE
jgi:hypothetical protein